tara:strand:+ start:132 stop:458 length:327 start_codon:yes stop_codon:yes gene_type:complete
MKITQKRIRQLIQEELAKINKSSQSISESRKHLREEDKITLADGGQTTWGTEAHVNDLENSLDSLKRMRDAQRRGTASRMAYSQAVKSLQAQLKSAKRYFDKNYSSEV